MRISDWSSDVCSSDLLVGQGIANILSPLFGGIAATGAIARTATNIRNGGTSPLAGVVHSVLLVLVLLFLAPLAGQVPLAALAAIRSEERRVGQGGVRTCRYPGAPDK